MYVRPILQFGCVLFSEGATYTIRPLVLLEQDALRLCLDHNLKKVLSCISKWGMKLNQKCGFTVQELTFFGQSILDQGISPMESKINTIINALPLAIKHLQSFLGLTAYYAAKFLHHYAELVDSLRK